MHWMFTIYSNHQDGNSVHRHKTIKFDVVGKRTATKHIQISYTLDYKNCITLNHSPYFLKYQNGMARTIWFPNRNFWFSQVNGKYPRVVLINKYNIAYQSNVKHKNVTEPRMSGRRWYFPLRILNAAQSLPNSKNTSLTSWRNRTRTPILWYLNEKKKRLLRTIPHWKAHYSTTCSLTVDLSLGWFKFESWRWHHMWVEFVVGSLSCSKRFFSGTPVFPPP